MEKINKQDKELIVRKRTGAFIEKVFRFCGYDFRHDEYKQIIYGEIACKTPLESKIKSHYDAYHYLLSNAKSPLSSDIVKKFFFIMNGELPSEEMVIRMISKFFYLNNLPMLERAIEYHLYVYSLLEEAKGDQKLIIPLMFFNYVLIKSGIPTLRFVSSTLKKYEECRLAYFKGDKVPLYELFLEQIQTAKFQDKSYYKKLKPLSIADIFKQILGDKEQLKMNYGVESIAVFGSFAKNLARIDSDVDLLVVFSQDLSYEARAENAKRLAEYYFNIFNRYVDVLELSERVNDWIIREIIQYKIIF